MDKKALSERDICTKFIAPAIQKAGWDMQTQLREEVYITKGRIIVRGRMTTRAAGKRVDYILYYKSNIPIAIIEAKDNHHSVGDGMQQALNYAEMIDVPFVFSSNGDAFLAHDRTGQSDQVERELSLDEFPSPKELWRRYCAHKGLTPEVEAVVAQDYYADGSGKDARYYQLNAVNRAVEAVAKGQDRLLLVMATGTGKTYTAFQIIWRLWKAGAKRRILFLADRNILVDQAKTNDFKPFGKAMTKIKNRKVNKAFEIYLALYQAISGTDERADIFKQFSPDFFDLIVVDECHRGSAADNSAWRVILDYFSSATQIGLTATPKETIDVSTTHYFGEALYTYSLRQGIEDGFLAPYKVVRVDLDRDLAGWRPEKGKRDKHGEEIKDNDLDFEFSVWVHVAVLKLDLANVFPQYVAMALNSPHCYSQSQSFTHGIGNRDLGLTRMVLITLPLPPLQEQKRIVARVEQFMKLCDVLGTKLRRAEDQAAKFVEAVVQELVE